MKIYQPLFKDYRGDIEGGSWFAQASDEKTALEKIKEHLETTPSHDRWMLFPHSAGRYELNGVRELVFDEKGIAVPD